MGAISNYSSSFSSKYGKGYKMSYVSGAIGIILAFAWAIFLLNRQRSEIISLKAQLLVERDYTNDLESDVNTCKSDVQFLKDGTEDLISSCRPR